MDSLLYRLTGSAILCDQDRVFVGARHEQFWNKPLT